MQDDQLVVLSGRQLFANSMKDLGSVVDIKNPWLGEVSQACIASDAHCIIVGLSDSLEIYELGSRAKIRQMVYADFVSKATPLRDICQSETCRWLVTAQGQALTLWEWASGKAVAMSLVYGDRDALVKFRPNHPDQFVAVTELRCSLYSIKHSPFVDRRLCKSHPLRTACMSRDGSNVYATWSRSTTLDGQATSAFLTCDKIAEDSIRHISIGSDEGYDVDVDSADRKLVIPCLDKTILSVDIAEGKVNSLPIPPSCWLCRWSPDSNYILSIGTPQEAGRTWG